MFGLRQHLDFAAEEHIASIALDHAGAGMIGAFGLLANAEVLLLSKGKMSLTLSVPTTSFWLLISATVTPGLISLASAPSTGKESGIVQAYFLPLARMTSSSSTR